MEEIWRIFMGGVRFELTTSRLAFEVSVFYTTHFMKEFSELRNTCLKEIRWENNRIQNVGALPAELSAQFFLNFFLSKPSFLFK